MLRVALPVRLLISQICLVALASALPFVLLSQPPTSVSKRAFDRVEEADFGLMRKRAFDRVDAFDFGLRKRAFDRIEDSDFGLMKRKRAFDRLEGGEFGLFKRSVPVDRDEAVSSLAHSIRTLRRLRRADYRPQLEELIFVPLNLDGEAAEEP